MQELTGQTKWIKKKKWWKLHVNVPTGCYKNNHKINQSVKIIIYLTVMYS